MLSVAAQVMSAWRPAVAEQGLSFSGQSRRGDPFSLQADASLLSTLGFEWRVPLNRGLVDYVRWFQSHVRDRL